MQILSKFLAGAGCRACRPEPETHESTPLTSQLGDAALRDALRMVQLCRHMTCATYEEGDWLYTQGATAHAVYVPLEGTLSVWANPVHAKDKLGPNDGA